MVIVKKKTIIEMLKKALYPISLGNKLFSSKRANRDVRSIYIFTSDE